MAKHHPPVPGGQAALSAKIAKVKRENPGLTNAQAAGKASGFLRHRAKKKRR